MEKNIIYTSHNINILELLYNIITKYDSHKENIISFSFDIDDINYYSQYYLDSINELTKYKIDPEPSYDFEGYEKEINKDFDLDDYVKAKYNYLVKILKTFDITCWEFKKDIYEWEYKTDNELEEVEIKKPLQNFYFEITVDIQKIKTKIIEYIDKEIIKKDFDSSTEIIEDAILKQFEKRWKDNIKIYNKDLVDIIWWDNKKHFKIWNDDWITIVYYNDVLELFLMMLYLDWKIDSITNIWRWIYEIKWNLSKKILKKNILLANWNIEINKNDYIITYKTKPIILKYESNYSHMLLKILIDNIWEYVDVNIIRDEIIKQVNQNKKNKFLTSLNELSRNYSNIYKSNSSFNFLKDYISMKDKKIILKIK